MEELEETQVPEKTPFDIAKGEIIAYLDYKRVPAKKREEMRENIDKMAEHLLDKNVSLNPANMVFTQKLLFPENVGNVKEITFKPRLKQVEVSKRTQGLKAGDTAGYLRAYICALTDKPADFIANLDTEDYAFGQALAVFFI